MPATPLPDPAALLPVAALPGRGWTGELWGRIRHLLWLKLFGVTAFMWLFFIGYFHLLRHPARPVLEMPLTALDLALAPQPAMFWAYVSLWFYVGIAPGLQSSLRQLVVYGLWGAAVCVVGLLCFYLVPTAVPRPEMAADLAHHPGFALLAGVDAPGNACPSMHVAAALYTAIWIDRLLRQIAVPWPARALNVGWMLLIVYSTLAIKQHVALDVVGGALLAVLFAWPSQRWFPHGDRLRARGASGGAR